MRDLMLRAVLGATLVCSGVPGSLAADATAGGPPVPIGVPLSPFEGMKSADEALVIMRQAGLKLMDFRQNWSTLEPAPGKVDFRGTSPFHMLDHLSQNYPQLLDPLVVNLKPIETMVRTMPTDLAGKPFDDPLVLQRFGALIDALAGHPRRGQITHVVVGQEVDVYLAKHPHEQQAFLILFRMAVDRIRARLPHAKAGVVVTTDGINRAPMLLRMLTALSDVVLYTYYPMDPAWRMRPIGDVPADMKQLGIFAGGKPFGMLEVGYSASPLNAGSPELQARFAHTVFTSLDYFRRTGQLQLVNYYMLFDFPPEEVRRFAQKMGIVDPVFQAYLGTLGLREYHNQGRPRPAWDVIRHHAGAWSPKASP